MGEYCLVDSKANLNVALRPGLSPGDYKLSVPLIEWNDMISLPLYTLKNIWSTTEFILSKCKLQQMFGGNMCNRSGCSLHCQDWPQVRIKISLATLP